jgi:nucleoside-diphosphate-sugar epimerase
MAKVVITGANGFLGSWVARYFANSNFDVVALVRQESDTSRIDDLKGIKIIKIAGLNWNSVVINERPDFLILLDWAGVSGENRNDSVQNQNLLRWNSLAVSAREVGVKRLVAFGSQAEVGPINIPITEDEGDRPTTLYGEAKVRARLMLQQTLADSSTEFAWGRIFSTYGPMDNKNWFIPSLINALNENQQFKMTKGEQEWSYLHSFDFASAVFYIATNQNLVGVINIGNPNSEMIRDVALEISHKLGKQELLQIGSVKYRSDQVMKLVPITNKLDNVGWRPIMSSELRFTDTIDWFSNIEKVYKYQDRELLQPISCPPMSEKHA